MDVRADIRTDGHLRLALLGQLCRIVDLKTNHVTLTTPIKGCFVISWLTLDIFALLTKFFNSCISCSKDMIASVKVKMGHVTLTTPLLRVVCHKKARTWNSLPVCEIWQHCSFSRSRDMVGAHQNSNGSRNLTMPLSGMVCHLRASIFYYQPIYQMWSRYLYPLRIYKKWYKM